MNRSEIIQFSVDLTAALKLGVEVKDLKIIFDLLQVFVSFSLHFHGVKFVLHRKRNKRAA